MSDDNLLNLLRMLGDDLKIISHSADELLEEMRQGFAAAGVDISQLQEGLNLRRW